MGLNRLCSLGQLSPISALPSTLFQHLELVLGYCAQKTLKRRHTVNNDIKESFGRKFELCLKMEAMVETGAVLIPHWMFDTLHE